MVRPRVAPPGLSVGVSLSRFPTAYALGFVLPPLPGLSCKSDQATEEQCMDEVICAD